jgi:hypothetical protein
LRLGFFSLALIGCLGGTETDVFVQTDVPCASISNAIVSLIHPGDPPASGAQTVLFCNAGDYGSAVYHPDSTTPNDVVVVVATVDGSDPAACLATPGPGCIVARHLAQVAYQTNVSVTLQAACAGVPCDDTSTCENGVCVPY